jgi:multiple sugar transport system ATP-binding protein
VKVVESLGRETLIYADAGPLRTHDSESQEGYIAVHRPHQSATAWGRPIRLSIDPRDVFVFDPAGPTLRFSTRQTAA